jgi:ATP adenylyltransferase/5',5'''-P-1,P-4-tetraphosphate phosphorylase II
MDELHSLFERQLNDWKTVRDNYKALSDVRTKTLDVEGVPYLVQFNPARIISSAAKIDKASLKARKCFLCAENRPAEQKGISFGTYQILVNPFPIFPVHFTIPDVNHQPQRIEHRLGDMLDLADYMHDFVLFYNGPKCGASAPDHVHFQAGNKGFLPIEKEWSCHRTKLAEKKNVAIWHLDFHACSAIALESSSKDELSNVFQFIYQSLEKKEGEDEPMLNILAWKEEDEWVIIIFPREKHRPSCYFAEGNDNILISPASVDMGGVFIIPLEKDFNKISSEDIRLILKEVCLSKTDIQALENKIIQIV